MKTEIEPGLVGTFRLFAGLEAALYFVMVLYFWTIGGGIHSEAQYFYYLNMLGAGALFFYLNWPWLQQHLKGLYLPLALAVATILPVLTNRAFLDATAAGNSDAPIINAWQWMPMLFVPLVIIAWQYNMFGVVLFSVFTGYADLALVLSFAEKFSLQLLPVLLVSIIRTVSFIVVGYIVTQLMKTQRKQHMELLEANHRISQYSMTIQQLAVSRERNRLAREMHDTLAHTLSGLAVLLEAMKTSLSPSDTEAQGMLDHALSVTRSGLTETRRALKDLRATRLDDMGIGLALHSLVDTFIERSGIAVNFSVSPDIESLGSEKELGIYRIAQEALENVVRHAGATLVEFRLVKEEEKYRLEISDNGSGFDLNQAHSGDHFGLYGMYEWAETMGGALVVDSQSGKGTRVSLVLEKRNERSSLNL